MSSARLVALFVLVAALIWYLGRNF